MKQASGLRPRASGKAIAIALLVALAPVVANACPVCFGDPNAPMQKGVNNGIWVLLGFIGFVQIGFVALFWSFYRRARALRRTRERMHLIEGGAH